MINFAYGCQVLRRHPGDVSCDTQTRTAVEHPQCLQSRQGYIPRTEYHCGYHSLSLGDTRAVPGRYKPFPRCSGPLSERSRCLGCKYTPSDGRIYAPVRSPPSRFWHHCPSGRYHVICQQLSQRTYRQVWGVVEGVNTTGWKILQSETGWKILQSVIRETEIKRPSFCHIHYSIPRMDHTCCRPCYHAQNIFLFMCYRALHWYYVCIIDRIYL